MMFPAMQSSFPPTSITTGQIQNYLDENKKLILAILDNQNMGKLAECAQYQAQLQKNLMYLAAIADSQPQTPTIPTQMSPHTPMQQGGFYMQQQQQQQPMAQQQGILPPRGPPFNSPHPLQNPQATRSQGQMGLRPNMGTSNSRLNDVLGGAGGSISISISKQEDKAGSDAHRRNGDGEETQ